MTPTHSPRYKWAIVAMAFLAIFGVLGLGRFGYASVLPSMQDALGLSNTQAGALATWNLVGYTSMAVVSGVLASRFGFRLVMTAGLVTVAVAMFLTGFAGGMTSAAAARAFTGFGAGAVNVPAMAITAVWFDARRRGLASGIVVTGSSLGLIVAGPLVPRIIDSFGADGWRVSWFVFAAVAAVLAVLAFLVIRNRPYDAAQPNHRPVHARLDWRRMHRSGYAWRLAIAYLTYGVSYFIYLTFFVKRLTGDLGYSDEAAGTLFMALGLAAMFCGVWGHISDRIGRRYALAIVSLTHAASFALFALWTSTAGLTLSAVLFGITIWSIPGIVTAACGDLYGPALAPNALGFLTVFLGLGQIIGPTVAGAMADATSSFESAYLLAAGVALTGGLVMLLPPLSIEKDPVLAEDRDAGTVGEPDAAWSESQSSK